MNHRRNIDTSDAGAEAYRCRTVSDHREIEDLAEDWRRLADKSNVFSTYEWFAAWWEHFGWREVRSGRSSLHLVVLTRSGRVSGIVPLMLRRSTWRAGFLRRLEFCDLVYSDYSAILFDRDEAAQSRALVRYLNSRGRKWELLILNNFPDGAAVVRCLDHAFESQGVGCQILIDEQYYQTSLAPGKVGIGSRNYCRSIRNKLNRFEKLRRVGFRAELIIGPDRWRELIEAMAAVEVRKCSDPTVPAEPLIARHRSFFERIFETLGDRVYVGIVSSESQVIAYELGFQCDDKLWCYTKAYDPTYRYYNPGTVLMLHVAREASESGFVTYDHLRGREEFKRRFSTHSRFTLKIRATSGRRLARLCGLAYYRLRPRIFRLLERAGLAKFDGKV